MFIVCLGSSSSYSGLTPLSKVCVSWLWSKASDESNMTMFHGWIDQLDVNCRLNGFGVLAALGGLAAETYRDISAKLTDRDTRVDTSKLSDPCTESYGRVSCMYVDLGDQMGLKGTDVYPMSLVCF